MLQRYGWRRLLLCAVLEFAALSGAPLRPKDIENSLRPRNEISSQQQCRKDCEEPDPILPEPALRGSACTSDVQRDVGVHDLMHLSLREEPVGDSTLIEHLDGA